MNGMRYGIRSHPLVAREVQKRPAAYGAGLVYHPEPVIFILSRDLCLPATVSSSSVRN